MDYFGVNSAEDLPKIKEVLSNQMMEGTAISHRGFGESSSLAVTDDGELIDGANEETEDAGTVDNREDEGADDIISSEDLNKELNEQPTGYYNSESHEETGLDEEDNDDDDEAGLKNFEQEETDSEENDSEDSANDEPNAPNQIQ